MSDKYRPPFEICTYKGISPKFYKQCLTKETRPYFFEVEIHQGIFAAIPFRHNAHPRYSFKLDQQKGCIHGLDFTKMMLFREKDRNKKKGNEVMISSHYWTRLYHNQEKIKKYAKQFIAKYISLLNTKSRGVELYSDQKYILEITTLQYFHDLLKITQVNTLDLKR